MERTIKIEDDLQERIEDCKTELKDEFFEYLNENPDTDSFDDWEPHDRISEIVDSNTPIYYYNIDSLYYLYSDEFEDAYNNAGCYDSPPDNYKQVCIYFYLEQETWEYLREIETETEDFFNELADLKNEQVRKAFIKSYIERS